MSFPGYGYKWLKAAGVLSFLCCTSPSHQHCRELSSLQLRAWTIILSVKANLSLSGCQHIGTIFCRGGGLGGWGFAPTLLTIFKLSPLPALHLSTFRRPTTELAPPPGSHTSVKVPHVLHYLEPLAAKPGGVHLPPPPRSSNGTLHECERAHG